MSAPGGAPRARPETEDRVAGLVLGAALVAMGLIAGLFYAYSCSVMPRLADVDDRTFIDSMQRINDAIQNPVFFLSFMGAIVITPVAAVLEWRSGRRGAATWAAIALACYGITFIVTVAFNIPLNDDLANVGDPTAITDLARLAEIRDDFEDPWVAWNNVRTVSSTVALACLGRALVLHGWAERSTTR